jgi:hypothetical protein
MAADTPFKDHVGMSQSQVPPVHLQQNTGSSTADEMPFSRDGLLTFRKAEQPVPLQATSVSRGSLKINQEGELKKYIMMVRKTLRKLQQDNIFELCPKVTSNPAVLKQKCFTYSRIKCVGNLVILVQDTGGF